MEQEKLLEKFAGSLPYRTVQASSRRVAHYQRRYWWHQ